MSDYSHRETVCHCMWAAGIHRTRRQVQAALDSNDGNVTSALMVLDVPVPVIHRIINSVRKELTGKVTIK